MERGDAGGPSDAAGISAVLEILDRATSRLWQCRTLTEGCGEILWTAVTWPEISEASLYLLSSDGASLRLAGQRGFDKAVQEPVREVPLEHDGVLAKALGCGELLMLDQASPLARGFPRKAHHTRTVHLWPLSSRKLVGALLLYSETPLRDRREDVAAFRTYARQAAEFVERCRMVEHLHASESNLRALLCAERKQAEERSHLLMREISHRSKNLLAVVQAIARQSSTHNADGFLASFDGRIEVLAAMQDLLIKSQWSNVDLHDLVGAILATGQLFDRSRVRVSGPPIQIAPESCQHLGLAIHELVANACTYGALAKARGTVELRWQNGPSRCFEMIWREYGGPAVMPPTHQGFGAVVLGSMMRLAFDAQTTLDFDRNGFVWTLRCATERMMGRNVGDRDGP